MSELMILGEGSTEGLLGTDSICQALQAIVNSELQTEFGDEARLDPGKITLTALGYKDRTRFEVCSWNTGIEDDPYGVAAQPHMFMLELGSDGDQTPLAGKHFILSDGEKIKVNPVDVLFLLGLDFRALAHNNAAEQPKR